VIQKLVLAKLAPRILIRRSRRKNSSLLEIGGYFCGSKGECSVKLNFCHFGCVKAAEIADRKLIRIAYGPTCEACGRRFERAFTLAKMAKIKFIEH
jgi:hypothetical protein